MDMETFVVSKVIAAGVKRTVAEMQYEIEVLRSEKQELEAQVENLNLCLAVETASTDAHRAEIAAWSELHPNSPMLASRDHKFSDGTPKPVARVVFEVAFDESLKKQGITDPLKYRRD